VARRRRRRGGVATATRAPTEKRLPRAEEKRRAEFEQQQRAITRRRTFVGALGFIPLAGMLGCNAGLELACLVPREWWLALWAALFGSFLGLTIRLILERRKFQRNAANSRSS
jgi:hypothetical protein